MAGTLTVDDNTDGDGFISMATGGMLALLGDADDSLIDFLSLVGSSNAIRYWDDSTSGWAGIRGAMPGSDYTLAYIDDSGSGLYGYTVLTVGVVPEPGVILMLLVGMSLLLVRRSR